LLRRRADEGHASRRAGQCEVSAFAEETVTGMHGVALALAGNRDQARDVEVRGRPAGAQRHRLVGMACVRR
jgi:hypothetical protein